jgi:membrane protein implicated in regulation of membrane protease activity
MNEIVVWFVLAAVLVVAELLTGTFYLLMVAIGCAVAGLIAMAGGGLPLQLVVGAAVGIGATLILRRTRWGVHRRDLDAATNRDVILDIGEVIQVEAWTDGAARVRYRGCQWDAQLEPGAPSKSGAQVIKAIRGSTLVVAPVA